MASTNKTPHLGLCQWVETDPLLMDDMNDTLEKIDAAIEERGRKKLLDITVSEATSSVTLDFSEIPTEEYAELEFIFNFATGGKSMRFNDSAGGYSYHGTMSASITEQLPAGNGVNRLSISQTELDYHPSAALCYYSVIPSLFPLQNAEIFASEYNQYFKPSDRITVWGLKR